MARTRLASLGSTTLLRQNRCDAIAGVSKPTIAVVNGYCLGGGAHLAMSCDFGYASAEAKFGIPAARLSIIDGERGTQKLLSLVGLSQAKRILFGAERFDAREALRIGFVDHVAGGETRSRVWLGRILDRGGDTDIHLHPADVPGAIVALDRMDQPASWRWAGPAWIAKAPAQIGPGRVTGATLTAREPTKLARTWAAALGAEAQGDRIALDGGELRFVKGERDGFAAFHVEGLAADVAFGSIRFFLADRHLAAVVRLGLGQRGEIAAFVGTAQVLEHRLRNLGSSTAAR
ncbi:enoyl-CoA hydratase/isomerase family protein [Variovorax sp. LjRoot84]|uniref:enoyl-CoA hydratase/isomerase family protein n=1 Tax=Variovorax sp. LjRoot84 TaxID=3342340 RepID=UPI003F51155B